MKLTSATLLCLALTVPLVAHTQSTPKKIVAYVTSWSHVIPDPFVMTHINYAFGGVGRDSISVYADNIKRMQRIVELKKKNPKLKVLLSVGGWRRGNFTPMAMDEAKRKAFARSCRDFCKKYGLDGIDVDWEFPGNNSSKEDSPPDEKKNYTLLLRDLREALGNKLLLTMASSSTPSYYDYANCIQYLDFVNVMTYDMSTAPNHHSALYRGGKVGNGWKVQTDAIEMHINAGIPVSKLVMGLAFYGNSGNGSQISLQAIKNGIASGKWKDNWDETAKVPYVTDAEGKFAYGYDNERSLTIKCQYIIQQKLAGAMYWEYANDDNEGTERRTVYKAFYK
ncbi:MAG: glycoside hydrolase family 18 protein [Bacteroidaceae bacterium]|nr:glycoside hydrolase family 18 protein [Bacteroidaceae bacterium]